MVRISGFGKTCKAYGIDIKAITRILSRGKNPGGEAFGQYQVLLRNGEHGLYSFQRNGQGMVQRINVGSKEIMAYSRQSELNGLVNCGRDGATIPETKIATTVRDGSKELFASVYKRTPTSLNYYKDPVTGRIKGRVNLVQELHESRLVGDAIILPTDRLMGSDGKFYPIFQRDMYMGKKPSDLFEKYWL